jgi:hypothetical protein
MRLDYIDGDGDIKVKFVWGYLKLLGLIMLVVGSIVTITV